MKLTKKDIMKAVRILKKAHNPLMYNHVGFVGTPYGMIGFNDGELVDGSDKAKEWFKEELKK